MNLNQIKSELNSIDKEISSLRARRRDLEHAKLELLTGFKQGDLVEDEIGRRGILEFMDNWPGSWGWRRLKKDGTPYNTVGLVWKVKKVEE